MQTYSSTMLRYFVEHCPKALDFHLRGEPEETDIYQAGISAHAVLQVVGEKKATSPEKMRKVADAVVHELITTGRSYYGAPRPPMNPEPAFAGREIALEYLAAHQLPGDEEKARFEIALGMDAEGKPCDVTGARWRAIIDVVYEDVHGDEDFNADVVVVRDYKSAWPTGESELETLQRKGQGVLAWLQYPEKQGVRMEVVNLRTHQTFSRVVYFDDAGIELLETWRRDIMSLCKAADVTRVARPGTGCVTCPFITRCPDAQKLATAAESAVSLAVLEGLRESLRERLKAQLVEADGIEVPGGFVGFKSESKSEIVGEAIDQILAMWYNKPLSAVSSMSMEKSLLKAIGLGSSQVANVAKILFNGDSKAAREDFIALCTRKISHPKFGVWEASPEQMAGMKFLTKSAKTKKKTESKRRKIEVKKTITPSRSTKSKKSTAKKQTSRAKRTARAKVKKSHTRKKSVAKTSMKTQRKKVKRGKKI